MQLRVVILLASAWAQSGPELAWTPVVEVRARVLGQEGVEAADGVSLGQRARLGLEAERGWLTARVSFQEVREWTRSAGAASASLAPSVAEGWAKVDARLSDATGVVVTAGRQAVVIDEGRLVGARPWEMEGQFLDALRVEGRMLPLEVEYVNARRFDAAGEDPLGLGVNVVRFGLGRDAPVTRWRVDALSVVDARETAATSSTFGTYVKLDSGRWRSRGEVYVQSNPYGVGTLGSLSAGWVFGPDEGWVLRGEGTTVSGDRDGDGPFAPFGPVLGDTHEFLGSIDLFATPPTSAGGAVPGDRGVMDAALALHARPWRAFEGDARLHHFRSTVDQSRYGEELDLRGRWWFSPYGAVEAGYGHFFPARGFRDAPADWGYLDLDVAF